MRMKKKILQREGKLLIIYNLENFVPLHKITTLTTNYYDILIDSLIVICSKNKQTNKKPINYSNARAFYMHLHNTQNRRRVLG